MRSRGFTLVEMLIALLVAGIAISGALLMIRSQQHTFQASNKLRQAQNAARGALLFLEQRVPLAGFGLDPAEAFDFQWYRCAGACPRDFNDAPDELVYYARNLNYRVVEDAAAAVTTLHGKVWKGLKLNDTTISLEARAGDVFRAGQILQYACDSALVFTMVTLQSTTVAPADGPLDLQLEPLVGGGLVSGSSRDPFRRQDAADTADVLYKKWNNCFLNNARVFQVDRYRFYVRPVVAAAGRTDPYLVLDQGVDRDGDGDVDLDDEVLVAEGIENFQVSYAFVDPAIPPTGTTPGTVTTVPNPGTAPNTTPNVITPTWFPGVFDAVKQYPFLASSQYFTRSTTPLEPKRKTNDQGNIRAVRISLVARSPEPDPQGIANLTYVANSPLWTMNFTSVPAWLAADLVADVRDRYMRAIASTFVEVPNLASRGFLPN
jgi:type IV pilus assembly protein PilW